MCSEKKLKLKGKNYISDSTGSLRMIIHQL
jgi:hypothetical protein